MIVRFRYGLIACQRYPGDPRTDADLYREALGLAVEAERLGFDSVWASEHHFADDSYAPSLFPLCAAMAAPTSRIEIGTCLALAPLYHPIRLAEDAAVVDLISGGRFVLGLGQGWLQREFRALGVPFGEQGRRIRAAIETCRQAWGEGLVEDAGVAVTPKPTRPAGPAIWVGAHREPATGASITPSTWPRSPRSGTSTATAAPATSARSLRARPTRSAAVPETADQRRHLRPPPGRRPANRSGQQQRPGTATGERLCLRGGRLTPQIPALRTRL
jgi:alkanesulfonate monooxygenase SsuD/methylene tetrahydromethanopterin reductase-like flavin-dependent oxidoreductase (luciferase family)